jgi:tRNA modification GTPase
VLLVIDDTAGEPPPEVLAHLPTGLTRTLVRNKIDLSGRAPGMQEEGGVTEIALSARTGAGLELLRTHLKQSAGLQTAGEGTFMARRRHLDALQRARQHLINGRDRLQRDRAGELLAEELRQAQNALGEITGEFTPEDLLGRIFSTFCIGK